MSRDGREMIKRSVTLAAAVGVLSMFPGGGLPVSNADASKPTVGRPPIPGKYVLSPNYGSGSTGPGSLVLKKNGHHDGYTVISIRLKLPQGCANYAGKVARLIPALHPQRFVAHRILENEVGWGVSRKKHFRRTGRGNVEAIIDGETFPANIDLLFFRGIPAFKPVAGDIELPQVDPECFLSWQGHREH